MPRPTPRATSLARTRAAAQARAETDASRERRLLSKRQVLDLIPVTYVTLWNWMKAGTFPRSRRVGGKVMWLEHEIVAWILARPVSTLQGDST